MSFFKRTGKKGLSVLLALGILLSVIVAAHLSAAAAGDITVYIDFEGYNLGQGFYVEPVKLTLSSGSTAADATAALFAQQGINAHGLDSGYISEIQGFDTGTVNIPSYITGQPGFEQHSATNADGWLGATDYTSMSGWMYTINHEFGNGIDFDALKDGDVIRWQFSVWGYGLDLGVDNGWSPSGPYYDQADKTYLIRLLFDAGAQAGDKTAALNAIINPLATEAQVATAEDALIATSGTTLATCGKLIAPTAATVSVVDGNAITASASDYYVFNPMLPVTVRNNGGDTKIWYYNSTWVSSARCKWRAEMPGKVTQAGWGLTTAGITADFDSPGKDNPGDTVTAGAAVAEMESGSMHLNINGSNFLQLSAVDDEFQLYAIRAWEIIQGAIGNKVMTPDYHYELLAGEDVVEVMPDDDLWWNYRSTITALQEGTAILEITYDAIDVYLNGGGAGGGGSAGNAPGAGRFGASNPERKGIAVITVGDIAAGDVQVQLPWSAEGTYSNWDSEFDTWYFLGDSEEIVINPTAANVASVQAWNPDAQGDWVDVTDGKLTLYPGNNIVKVTVPGGLSYYKVIRGNTVKIVSDAGDRPLKVGDTVQVLWGGGLPAYPVAKISGVYNPGNYTAYSTWDDTFTVTQQMIDDGLLYVNASSKWPNSTAQAGSDYRRINSAAGGGHRSSALTGAVSTSPNSGKNAVSVHGTSPYGVIPPIRLTDYFPADPADVTVTMQLPATFGDGFALAKQELTVEPNLSETYGLQDAYNGGAVTALDALVAAHITMFGDDDVGTDITGSGGWYSYAYAANSLMCFVNGEQPGDGLYVNNFGMGYLEQLGYSFDQTLLSDGDDVFFYDTQDGTYYSDYYTWFEQDGEKVEAIPAVAGEDIDLSLMGLMNWYLSADPATRATKTEEVDEAAIQYAEIDDSLGYRYAEFEDSGIMTDYGEFTLRFAEPGAYIISALTGDSYLDMSSPWLEITVTPSAADLLAAAKAAKITAINAVDDTLTEADYTPESWSALQSAIAQAIADVNAATTLAGVDAVDLPSTSGLVTKAAELAAAKAAKIALINAVDDTLIEADYTPESWAALQSAIAQAIVDVNAATDIAGVDAVDLPSTNGLVTKAAELAAAKTAKIAAINAVTNGLTEADYTAESWAALQSTIAQAIADVNTAGTVAEVNAVAVPTTNGLVTNAAVLAAAKAEKIAAINAVADGLNPADYTPESWALLQAAITKAVADVHAATTVAEVDAVAIPTKECLVSKPNPPKLTCLQKWEAKLPKWLSGIPGLPDWFEWIIMIVFFGWIWWLF